MNKQLVLAILLFPTPALAQADANPVKSAGDAFGHKRGDEAIGLYDERSVRGFNLEAAGNYRLNGTYFVKNSGVSNFFIDSSTVRIGYNNLETILPGPSGVVDYRLRDPAHGEKNLSTISYESYGQPVWELNLRHGAESGASSYSIGISRNFDVRNAQGGKEGEDLLVGGIARLSNSASNAQFFAGEYQYRRRGEFRVVPSATALPPRIERGRYLGQRWAFDEGQRRIAGLLVDTRLSDRVGIGATAAFGQEDPTRAIAQFFRIDDESGRASVDMLAVPQQRSTSWSFEGRSHVELPSRAATHRFDLTLRYRRSTASFGGARSFGQGIVDFGEAPQPIAEPEMETLQANQHIHVEQTGIGLAYRANIGDRIRWNVGALKSFYRKLFSNAIGAETSNESAPLLYNMGAGLRVARNLEIYGSYSRGLEEAGVAPNSASNRNEILDTITVRQIELGARLSLASDLNLFLAAFDTRKPYAGVDPADNLYRFLGKVRHRGAELSLSAKPIAGLQLVVGGALIDPRLSTDSAVIGPRPVGVPRYRGIMNADFAIPGVRGLSIDAGVTHIGARAARSSLAPNGTQPQVKALTTANIGVRFAFRIQEFDAVLRAQVLNVTNRFAWDVNASETLAYNEPRRARMLLTVRF